MAALPGPMLGSFDSFEDALLASCRKIIQKPNATAGRKDHQDFWTRWRVSTEYCAWIYYTPDDKYEVSRLTDQSEIDPADRSRTCLLPSRVEDRRYPPDSIKYICSLHNHLFDDALSRRDIGFIVSQGLRHGFESTTADGVRALSIVAFFSNNVEVPTCDGFHQYVPASGKLFKYTNKEGKWSCEQTGIVTWEDETNFSIEKESLPCPGQGVP
ncbi:MAG: hypothetical protein ACJ8AT_19825 [Hyalangium sp.]|uniref:hypothetical protein n=1 Tax=Hyalangium sp. TaxID=2028555 RepID=UPI00389A9F84